MLISSKRHLHRNVYNNVWPTIWTSWRRSVLVVHWKDWCWSWNSNTLPTWCEELTHWKRPWCWERFRAGGEGDNRGWDGWMASLPWWTWVWVDSGSWWWTGRPGMLRFKGSQRVGHDWAAELSWTELSGHHRPAKLVHKRSITFFFFFYYVDTLIFSSKFLLLLIPLFFLHLLHSSSFDRDKVSN